MLYKIYFIAFDAKVSFDNVLIFIIQGSEGSTREALNDKVYT